MATEFKNKFRKLLLSAKILFFDNKKRNGSKIFDD